MMTQQAKKATQKMDKRFCDKNSTAKPDSPGVGGARRDGSTAKKDDVDKSTAKPNSPGPGDERRDDSTAKKDDDEDATTKPDDSTLPVMKA